MNDLMTGLAVGAIVPVLTNPFNRFATRKQVFSKLPFRDIVKTPMRGVLTGQAIGITRCITVFTVRSHVSDSEFLSGAVAGFASAYTSAPLAAYRIRLYVQGKGFFQKPFAGSFASASFFSIYWGGYFAGHDLAQNITGNSIATGACGALCASVLSSPFKVLSVKQRIFQPMSLCDAYKGFGAFFVRNLWAGMLTSCIMCYLQD